MRPNLPAIGLLAAALWAAAGRARADGIGAQAQDGYTNSSTTTTDETGHKSRSDSEGWTQRYRLSLDETPTPLVRFGASGLLDWNTASSKTDGVRTDFDTKTWDSNAHLSVGSPILSGGLDWDRRQETSWSRTAGVTSSAPTLVRDTYAGSASWHPLDMPTLDLRLSRVNAYDSTGRVQDMTTDEALLASRFDPTQSVDLRYSARYSSVDNRVGGVQTSEISNSASASWTDRFLGDRGKAYLGYAIVTRNTQTSASAAGAVVPTQRFPSAGLSLVEGPLDTPLRTTLSPNGTLVDGVTTTSAGVNLGYNASATPPVTARELGAQLPNDVTEVNLLYVFVDRNVSAVADQFTWEAYASDNGTAWEPIGIAGKVSFDALQWRFEIPIPPTTRRYLKVVTRPLVRQLTTDAQLADIFVTELQLFDQVAASLLRGRTFNSAGTLNGTARILLLRGPALAYDFSVLMTHSNPPSLVTYSVVNGLSAQRRLARAVSGSARVDRSDADAGKGHEGLNRWSGTLTFDPIPTFGGTIAYSGQLAQNLTGNVLTHSGTAFARADLYEGVSASTTGSAGWASDERGRTTRSTTASLSTAIVPNRVLSTTFTGSYNWSRQTGGGQSDQIDRRGILEATASLSPYRTVSLSGSVLHYFGTGGSSTLVNFNGGVALFPGGDLQLAYSYVETLDTSADSRTRTHGPSLRWNIRPGWILTSSYSLQHASSPQQTQDGQAIGVNLVATLR